MAIQTTVEVLLDEQLAEPLGAERYERVSDRRGHRNGSYSRSLVTSVGKVDVKVHRSRNRGSAGGVIGRYKRWTAVDGVFQFIKEADGAINHRLFISRTP